jgi:tetratricopeptide (TPR) repeat protein
VRDADRQRQDGNLEAARDGYRAALAIDADWAPAARAMAEVTTDIANARFDRTLSAGFAALGEEDYAAAIEAFTTALAMRPGNKAGVEGLAQAEQGEKLNAIALAEIRALAFERRELWDAAIERYETALATDPTLAFAVEGLERARARSDLDRKLENLIDNPTLLLDDDLLVESQAILEQARLLADSGERIASQTERLAALIDAATHPITVRLRSDEQTEVTVYRVGTLGAFAQKEIEIRPGTYTAIGSRRGYRDVRQTFTVLPGRPLETISIVCSEPI